MKRKKRKLKLFLSRVYQNNSMKMQFVLVYSLFVLVPTLAALLLMSRTANEKIQDVTLQTAEEMVSQISSNASFQFQQMANISLTISTNSNVRELLSRQNTDIYTDYCDAKKMQMIMEEIINISQGLEAKLYVDSKKSYSSQRVYFHNIETFYEMYDVAEDGSLPSQLSWVCNQTDGGPPSSISYISPVYSSNDITQVIAYLKVDMKYSDIEKLFTNISLSNTFDYFLVDHTGKTLYSSVEDQRENIFTTDELRQKQGVFQKGNAYYAYSQMDSSRWFIVYLVDVNALGTDTTSSFLTTTILIITLFAVFFLVMVLCLVLIVTHHYDRKIQAITDSLDAHNVSDLEPNLRKRVNNLDFLTANVNRLMLKVKDMTEQSVQREINEKKAELKALQFQINPHFLYNALDTINWAAIKRGDMVANRQIGLLAQYFRLVLNNGNINIHMSEELEFCRVYLQIQNEINAGKFTFEINTDELIRDITLPKMSIQPIVENALIHGVLKQRNHKGKILVLAQQTETTTRVKVWDNGVGFDVQRLQESMLQGGKDGFGLHNIYEKLKLFLGTDPVLHFRSDEAGTEVEITLEL